MVDTAKLGEIVWWDAAKASIERKAFDAAWKSHKLPVCLQVRVESEWVREAMKEFLQPGQRLIVLGGTALYTSYAIVSARKDALDVDVRHDTEEAIVVMRKTHEVVVRNTAALAPRMTEAVHIRLTTYNTRDLAYMVSGTLAKAGHGFPIRKRGGLWFIPRVFCGTIKRMEMALDDVWELWKTDRRLELSHGDLFDTPLNRNTVQNHVSQYVLRILNRDIVSSQLAYKRLRNTESAKVGNTLAMHLRNYRTNRSYLDCCRDVLDFTLVGAEHLIREEKQNVNALMARYAACRNLSKKP